MFSTVPTVKTVDVAALLSSLCKFNLEVSPAET